jgi:hypothetical protein
MRILRSSLFLAFRFEIKGTANSEVLHRHAISLF